MTTRRAACVLAVDGAALYEETNVASDPQHTARILGMASRLRQLRPNWPVDSEPNGPDPAEDE